MDTNETTTDVVETNDEQLHKQARKTFVTYVAVRAITTIAVTIGSGLLMRKLDKKLDGAQEVIAPNPDITND